MDMYQQAQCILKRCTSPNGIVTYPDRSIAEYWTTNALFIVAPALSLDDTCVQVHIDQLVKHCGQNIPTLYLITNTSDVVYIGTDTNHICELIFICTVLKDPRYIYDATFKESIQPCIDNAFSKYSSTDFPIGCDWRLSKDLSDKQLLTNACQLYEALKLSGQDHASYKLRLNDAFWSESLGYFTNYPDSDVFDLVGNSLAIITGIATEEQAGRIVAYTLVNLKTPHGLKMKTHITPTTDTERSLLVRDNHEAVIPWCTMFMLLAISKYDRHYVKECLDEWSHLTEFAEWYALNGEPCGALNHSSYAASYIRVLNALQ